MGGCLGGEKKPANNQPAAPARTLKILLIGAANGGKTSLLYRLTNDAFPVPPEVTISNDPRAYDLVMPDGERISLQIVDTGGIEKFKTITSTHYGGCAGVMICYDVNDMSSFQSLDNWFSEAERYSESPIILVGNKKDLDPANRVAKQDQLEAICKVSVETSALNGEGVVAAFQAMVQAIRDQHAD